MAEKMQRKLALAVVLVLVPPAGTAAGAIRRAWTHTPAADSPAEAEAALKLVSDAEVSIARELQWLKANKAARAGAKAIAAEIVREVDPALKAFKASDYARVMYDEGEKLRREGNYALSNGDFQVAKQKLESAKQKLSDAAANAKAFCINTHLALARKNLDASRWQQCVAECDTVLGWDAANADAKRMKAEAESSLVPSANLTLLVDSKPLDAGEKVTIGSAVWTTPVVWGAMNIATGKTYGGNVVYDRAGKRYRGKIDNFTVDWRGPTNIVVELHAEVDRAVVANGAGGDDLDDLLAEIASEPPKHKLRKASVSSAGPKTGAVKTLTLPGGATMEMIYVAPGSFMMGSPTSEDGHESDETQHRVTLTKGFWLGKYEVTQKQWQSVMGSNPSYSRGDDRPVETVSWEDCQKFIAKVDAEAWRQLGGGARLPTESEWEYACRAGTSGAYAARSLDALGWYSGNSVEKTHPVGQKQSNVWGFHDMHGNVWEWCSDWYGEYPPGNVTDPQGPASGADRVLRGGGWCLNARICRSADRSGGRPGIRSWDSGFRLCCSALP